MFIEKVQPILAKSELVDLFESDAKKSSQKRKSEIREQAKDLLISGDCSDYTVESKKK